MRCVKVITKVRLCNIKSLDRCEFSFFLFLLIRHLIMIMNRAAAAGRRRLQCLPGQVGSNNRPEIIF